MPCLTNATRTSRGCSPFSDRTQPLNPPATLADAVADFRLRLAQSKDAEVAFFMQKQIFANRLKDAALARYMKGAEGYKRCGHQWRLTPAALAAGLQALRPMAHRLEHSGSFDELHDRVLAVAHRTRGLGALWAYDTAVRIGESIGLAPEKIYLHAGTRKGAENLGFAVRKQPVLSLKEVHARYPELRKLSAGDLESFFCVYKREFPRLARIAPRVH